MAVRAVSDVAGAGEWTVHDNGAAVAEAPISRAPPPGEIEALAGDGVITVSWQQITEDAAGQLRGYEVCFIAQGDGDGEYASATAASEAAASACVRGVGTAFLIDTGLALSFMQGRVSVTLPPPEATQLSNGQPYFVLVRTLNNLPSGGTFGDLNSDWVLYDDPATTAGGDAVGDAVTPLAASSDATLGELSLTDIPIPFATATTTYTATVANEIATTTVTATPADDNAVVVVTATGGVTGDEVTLNVGVNTVTITVTAEDTTTTETYTVTVTREPPPSADATLTALTLDGVTLTADSDGNYATTVDHDTATVTLTATPTDTAAMVSGDGEVNLNVGVNTVTITVTAEDTTTATYTVTVTRESPPLSADATLSGLTLSGIPITFVTATTTYTATVANDIDTNHGYRNARRRQCGGCRHCNRWGNRRCGNP